MQSEQETKAGSGGLGRIIEAMAKAKPEFSQILMVKEGQQGHRVFKYAPLPEINRATDPALSKHGLAVVSFLQPVENTLFVVSQLRLAGVDEYFESRFPLTQGLTTQDRGKEITYGRRYNKCALLDVVGEEGDTDDAVAADKAALQAEEDAKDAARARMAERRKTPLKSAYDGRELAEGEDPAPKPDSASDKDALAGIDSRLAALMARDGITPAALKSYYVAKGHMPASVEPDKLPTDYVTGLVREANWKKATAAMKGGAK